MKVMVVGGGGREHAIVKAIAASPLVDKIYALPGNAGMAEAECVPIGAKELDRIVAFARENKIEFAVVAPDDPLVMGLVDLLEGEGIPCFGPTKAAAVIEGSKAFSKELMKRHRIPTAAYEIFTEEKEALRYLERCPLPAVVKADGLALGKGVIIAETREEAVRAVKSMMEDKIFGESGNRVVIEEFLTGPEVSVLAFTDGSTVVPMVSSMDHKRALDGDRGPNTGGMGTVAPNPFYTEDVARECMEKIFLPTVRAMREEGRTVRGCLYFGLMLTEAGPKVIEYNCRFGDPETQVVLPLLKSDLFSIMQSVAAGTLKEEDVVFSGDSACCVVLASEGYPQKYETGYPVTLDPLPADTYVYYAGVKEKDGALVTAGGRVLGVTATAKTLPDAIAKAYSAADGVHFENACRRTDIGKRAMEKIGNGI